LAAAPFVRLRACISRAILLGSALAEDAAAALPGAGAKLVACRVSIRAAPGSAGPAGLAAAAPPAAAAKAPAPAPLKAPGNEVSDPIEGREDDMYE